MPRVYSVKKARKDNPVAKRGEPYFWWKHAYSPKQFSLTYPKASELTQSDKLSRLYLAEETIDAYTGGIGDWSFDESHVSGLVELLNEVAVDVQDIAEEYQESADAIREHFAESPVADECEERQGACEEIVYQIEDAVNAIEDLEFPDDPYGVTEEGDALSDEFNDNVDDAVGQIDWS